MLQGIEFCKSQAPDECLSEIWIFRCIGSSRYMTSTLLWVGSWYWRLCSRAVSALDALCACALNWICGCVTLAHSRADCMYTNDENKNVFVSAKCSFCSKLPAFTTYHAASPLSPVKAGPHHQHLSMSRSSLGTPQSIAIPHPMQGPTKGIPIHLLPL